MTLQDVFDVIDELRQDNEYDTAMPATYLDGYAAALDELERVLRGE